MINKPLLGCHVSAAGSPTAAIENATRLGANTIQFFGSSPRQWNVRMPTAEYIEAHLASRKKSAVETTFLHGPYLVNLGSSSKEMRATSIKALTAHAEIARALHAEGVIFHMGSCKGTTREQSIEWTIEGMKSVLKAVPDIFLIMENSSGGGDKLGSTVDELGAIYRGVDSKRVKLCIDTAHTYESGLVKGFSRADISSLYKNIDHEIGIKNLIALHVNDSKTASGSNADRHENLGEGFIGLDSFTCLAESNLFAHCSWILEVPGFDGKGPDKKYGTTPRMLF